jgi:hypothetical protein
MPDDLDAANVNRAYSLAATSIAIFTFVLIFLYPKFISGDADPFLFQATLIVLAVAAFAFVLTSLSYYGSSLGGRLSDADRAVYRRRGDRFWLLGYTLLFLDPSLILFSVGLRGVGVVWLVLWLVYVVFVVRSFPRMQTGRRVDGRAAGSCHWDLALLPVDSAVTHSSRGQEAT